jgi:hypothetical protein
MVSRSEEKIMVEAVVAAYEAPLPNRGVQRMSLRSTADAESFGGR